MVVLDASRRHRPVPRLAAWVAEDPAQRCGEFGKLLGRGASRRWRSASRSLTVRPFVSACACSAASIISVSRRTSRRIHGPCLGENRWPHQGRPARLLLPCPGRRLRAAWRTGPGTSSRSAAAPAGTGTGRS